MFLNNILNEGIDEVRLYYPLIPDIDFIKLINLDPTYQGNSILGKYGKWILNKFNQKLKYKDQLKKWKDAKENGNVYPKPNNDNIDSMKNFSIVKSLLKKFDILNKELKLNINEIKSISELKNIVQRAIINGNPTKLKILSKVKLIKKSLSKGAEIIFKDKLWVVIIPKTLESSVVFGSYTDWCTTSPNGNFFNAYNTNSDKLFINLNMKTGELYQFHFESGQFFNKNNHRINYIKLLNTDSNLKNLYIYILRKKVLLDYKNNKNSLNYNLIKVLKEIDDNMPENIKSIVSTINDI